MQTQAEGDFFNLVPGFTADLNYQTVTLLIYDTGKLTNWFIPYSSLKTVSYILQDTAKISRDKDTCGAIITCTTVIKFQLT